MVLKKVEGTIFSRKIRKKSMCSVRQSDGTLCEVVTDDCLL